MAAFDWVRYAGSAHKSCENLDGLRQQRALPKADVPWLAAGCQAQTWPIIGGHWELICRKGRLSADEVWEVWGVNADRRVFFFNATTLCKVYLCFFGVEKITRAGGWSKPHEDQVEYSPGEL